MADLTYFVSALASAAGASKRHLTIWNGTSTQTVRILSVTAAGAPTAAVTGLVIPLYVARITAAPTGGSSLTGIKAVAGNAAIPGTVTFLTGATGGATEEASAFGAGVVSGEETSSANSITLYEAQLVGGQPFTLDPSTGIVVKQGALASAGAINVVVQFTIR